MFIKCFFRIFVLLSFAFSTAYSQTGNSLKIGMDAPSFSLRDQNWKIRNLEEFKGKYVVLEWINFDCPFVKRHYDAQNMQKLQKEYTSKGVIWLAVCSSAPGKQGNFDLNEIKIKMADYKTNMTAYLIDPEGTAGKLYNARTTPHMFVINPEGKLIYQGAIDDSKSTDVDDVPENVYVKQALDEAMAGKKVSTSTTQPYGCSVKYKD